MAEAIPAPLPPYRVQRPAKKQRLRRRLLLTLIALIAGAYGFLISIFPIAFYLYLAFPIALMVLLTIWALPASSYYPGITIERLFFALFLSTFLWPNYLAVTVPGLPWITIVRLWSLPLCLLFLISLSMSKDFRKAVWEPFTSNPLMLRLMLGLVLLQILTLPLSGHLGDSANRFINLQFQWTAAFFLSAYIFSKRGRADLWVILFCSMAVLLSLLAIVEYRLEKVLWAGHIPSFLAVQDERVQAILAGARRGFGAYRVQSVFTTSLNFAEFLGLSVPFFIYLVLTHKKLWIRLTAAAYIPLCFWMIRATDSRLGVVAFFATLLLYFLLWSLKSWYRRKRDIIAPFFVLTYPIVAGTFFLLSLFWQRLHDMIWGGGEQQASNDARKEQYASGFEKILSQPFGNGTGEATHVLGFTNAAGTPTIDTYYLVIALEYGVIGFLVFYGLIITGIWQSVRYGLKSYSRQADLLIAIGVMLTVFIIIKGVLAQEDSHALIFIALGMVAALTHMINKNSPDAQTGERPR